MPAAVPLANAPVMTARACIAVLSVGLPVAAVFEAFNVGTGLAFLGGGVVGSVATACIDRGIVGNGLAVLLLDAPFANALLNGIVDQSLDDACQIAVSDCIPLTDVQQLGVRFSSVKNTLVLCFVSCYV